MATTYKLIRTVRAPNHNGFLNIEQGSDGYYYIAEQVFSDDYPEDVGSRFSCMDEVNRFIEIWLEDMRSVPNWDLQDAYDEEHGTINGRDPDILLYQRLFENEL